MTIAFVQGQKGRVTLGTSAATGSMNTSTGNALLIGASIFILGTTFSSMTDNDGGASPTQDVSSGADAANDQTRLFSKLNITAKTGYIATLTLGSSSYGAIAVEEVSGLASSGAFDKSAHAGIATANSISATTAALSQNDEHAFGCASMSSGNAVTWSVTSSGWTQDQNTQDGAVAEDIISGYHIEAAGAAQTFGITLSGIVSSASLAVATYKGAAAASASPRRLTIMGVGS